jgi:hypothetical protein
MAIVIIFLLGIGNFAAHRAVLESRHPLVSQIPWFRLGGGKFSLIGEFFVLLGALFLVIDGQYAWGWAYVIYSVVNGASAWALLTGRV